MSILIVDDDLSVCQILKRILSGAGYEVSEAQDGSSGWALFEQNQIDLVLLDLQLPDEDGIELAGRMIQKNSAIPVVLISAYATVSRAVEATKIGVYDFLEKPIGMERFLLTAKNAIEKTRLINEKQSLIKQPERRYRMIGSSSEMRDIFSIIDKVAPTNSIVLLNGESGSGKDVIAQAIHYNSLRADNQLFRLNCAAIPDELLESELFGHAKGAFTNAYKDKKGLFLLADQSTLF